MELEDMKRKLILDLELLGIRERKVLDAIRKVRRENFVLESSRESAYENIALGIIKGQTISQPYTVAKMLELLDLNEGEKVLEIGAGSGYNAALIKTIVGAKGEVYSLEIIRELCNLARDNLKKEGIKGVNVLNRDGYGGVAEKAPFDKIIITAAAPAIPKTLLEQLNSNGGILLAPIGSTEHGQIMTKIVKRGGDLKTTKHGEFMFVPMVGRGF